MGNEISLRLRLTDTENIPVSFNNSSKSPIKRCQSSQNPNEGSSSEQVNPKAAAAQINDLITEQGDCEWKGHQTLVPNLLEIEKNVPESDTEDLAREHLQSHRDGEEKGVGTRLTSSVSYEREYEKKLKSIQQTLRFLDDSLHETRSLETENSFRYSELKAKNMTLQIDLDKANKRNKNMLNLFRQNAAEIGFGRLRTSNTLPEALRKDIQRTWSQKYDALLEQNNQLKKEAIDGEFSLKTKDKQIEDLQQRLLNLAEDLIQREKTIEKICTKFLSLKQRKDEQEILLQGSVETLQDALQKAKTTVTPSKSESCMIPSKDARIAREIRRSDRLAYENSLLRALLQEGKRSCRSSRTSSTISLCDKNF